MESSKKDLKTTIYGSIGDSHLSTNRIDSLATVVRSWQSAGANLILPLRVMAKGFYNAVLIFACGLAGDYAGRGA
ncbi:MAG: hypothetical protein JJ969_10770 [Rhizobiaceae bacterium]|nr:hypothetical protein [Rhizobiaceae bacterium]